MRPLGTLLLLLGLAGIGLGVLSIILPGNGLLGNAQSYATWDGVGPMIAGLGMLLFGLFLRGYGARS